MACGATISHFVQNGADGNHVQGTRKTFVTELFLIRFRLKYQKIVRNSRKVGKKRMTYKRGKVSISVHQLDGFGKNPALWIGTENPNQIVKVASFGSEDKANMFCKWLEYLLGFNNDEGLAKWE